MAEKLSICRDESGKPRTAGSDCHAEGGGFGSLQPLRRIRLKVEVTLDDERLELEPGQNMTPHGIDRNFSIDEAGALRSVVVAAS
jgi:hypothetical protein